MAHTTAANAKRASQGEGQPDFKHKKISGESPRKFQIHIHMLEVAAYIRGGLPCFVSKGGGETKGEATWGFACLEEHGNENIPKKAHCGQEPGGPLKSMAVPLQREEKKTNVDTRKKMRG